jgi:putative endonuclease
MERGGSVYIMTNKNNTTLYIGVTSDLISRVYQHKTDEYPGSFTSKYKLHKLVYYENFHSIEEAIDREKKLKKWTRKNKIKLIDKFNPEWRDLYDDICLEWDN